MTKCLRVSKKNAEKVRAFLLKEKLLSTEFKIKAEKELLLLPLKRELTSKDIIKLDSFGYDYEEINCNDLAKSKVKPNSHIEILSSILKEDEISFIPKSFDTIGDLVVVEISDELWSKRQLIGKAFLDAYPSIKTVLAKSGKVTGVERIRLVEFLAGEKKTRTFYTEHGIRYVVDVAKAYFSPRLSQEHTRIAQQVEDSETVVDLFCGIGPFVIPIAKKTHAKIHAIDINPEAIKLLGENIALNKIKGNITSYCGDCRTIIEQNNLLDIADRVIMNLPGYAINFLDVACRTLKKNGGVLHFFEFAGGSNKKPEEQIIEDVSREILKNRRTIEKFLNIRRVRMSAPRQWQMVADVQII